MTKEEYLTQRCVICGGSNYKCDCAYVMRGRKCEKIEEIDDAWDEAQESLREELADKVREFMKNFKRGDEFPLYDYTGNIVKLIEGEEK